MQCQEAPIHSAAACGHIGIIELLIAHGADIHGRNTVRCRSAVDRRHLLSPSIFKAGWTPLHFSAFTNQPEANELLIAHGADVHCKNQEGQSPLDYASTPELRQEMEQQFTARQQQHWSHRTPLAFGLEAEHIIIATLLCAKRCGLRLPVELWQHVFSFLQRRDFAAAH
eukprot:m.310560 g.310560  ORF g.310560 m.310560 type:complete len:169 (-) comp25476_c0_seq1:181-687(-)